MSTPVCKSHPDAAAAATCTFCLAPLCSACLTFERFQAACAQCAKRERTRRRGRSSLVLLLSFAGVVFLVLPFGLWLLLFQRPGEDSRLSGAAINLQERLRQSPCDRAVELELTEELMRVGAPKKVLAS